MPLVLLPAYPLDCRVWQAMAAQLPWGVRAIAVDLPGQGHSDIGGLAPSIDLAADAVYRSLTSYGIANAVVVGMSMGGYVALALADRHPGFVAGLGLVDTKSTADTDEARARRIATARELEMSQTLQAAMGMPGILLGQSSLEHRRDLLATLEGWVRGQSPLGLAWSQRAMARRGDKTGMLRHFIGPVSVVVGDQDEITPLSDAQHMADAAPDSTLTLVPGAGHLSALEDPYTVAAALNALHAQVVPHRR